MDPGGARVLSIVVPTLNAAGTLDSCLAALAGFPGPVETIVSDGGSTDGTVRLAIAAGARVIHGPPGRGRQLAAGADAAAPTGTRAGGDARGWLLFVHADTRLGPGWADAAARVMDGRGTAGAGAGEERAAAFRFVLDDSHPAARVLEAVVGWRCRLFGLPYGDQALLVPKTFYRRLGGFDPALPLMEDVDLVRRIGRRRLLILDTPAVTSAERYRRGGYLARPVRNLVCLSLYGLGVPVERIARLYGGQPARGGSRPL